MKKKPKRRVWADLEVGNEAIALICDGDNKGRRVRVEKIGRDWITAGGDKYSIETGHARESGGWLHSAATLAEAAERRRLLARLARLQYSAAGARVPLEALRAFVKALDEVG